MIFFKFYTMDIHYKVLELILTKSVNVNYQCNANYFNFSRIFTVWIWSICQSVLSLFYVYFHNLYSVWIWLILIKVTYIVRVSEMFQIKCVDIIISTLLWHWLDLVNLLLPKAKQNNTLVSGIPPTLAKWGRPWYFLCKNEKKKIYKKNYKKFKFFFFFFFIYFFVIIFVM